MGFPSAPGSYCLRFMYLYLTFFIGPLTVGIDVFMFLVFMLCVALPVLAGAKV